MSVAGKTGTAEFGPDLGGGTYASHAWFTGFAPAEDPEVAVVVFLEQGNGAKNAAPLGGRILNYYFHRGGWRENGEGQLHTQLRLPDAALGAGARGPRH